MNDDELITLVREQRTKVPMTTPVDEIISRGRAVRARRRLPGLAGGLAVMAGAALAVTALLPASDQGGQQPAAHLAAWTVTEHKGAIYVTIRQLRDPAALQSKLRADGVPATVTFGSEPNPSCRAYPGNWDLTKAGIQKATRDNGGFPIFTIDPAALPPSAGVQFMGANGVGIPGGSGHPQMMISKGAGQPGGPIVAVGPTVGVGLVQASARCTGS